MMGRIEDFGTTKTGENVQRVSISAGDLTADILTWGAVVQDLRHSAQSAPLVLGFDSLAPYEEHSPFFGATCGRCANRIRNGSFELDGNTHELDVDADGVHLHGGLASFGMRNWIIEAHGDDFVILALISRDGDGGYPGMVSVRATFRVKAPGTFSIQYEASTTAPTIVNLAHHSYFTLKGDEPNVLDHIINVPTSKYLELSESLVPTGKILDAAGTSKDYTHDLPISARDDTILDNNYCLSDAKFDEPILAASVSAPGATLKLECWSDQPGMQVYCGHKIEVPVLGLDGRNYGAYAGLCLEPQIWPDAINHEAFPSPILRPDSTYSQNTEYRFLVA